MNSQLFNRLIVLAVALLVASPAMAYLGSFESGDGYRFLGPLPNDWIDVTNYNAGATNDVDASYAPLTPIPFNSGLWKITGPGPGSFYINATDRATYINPGSPPAPPYPAGAAKGPIIGAYLIGDHGGGHTGNALAMRNTTPAGSGPMEYDYTIDKFDFGGIVPSTVTAGTIKTSFWFWPSNPEQTVVPPKEKFIMSFGDGTNIGFQWGYARDNQLYWRPGSSGAWNMTSLFANDPSQYDKMTMEINLTAQTFKIDFSDTSTSLTTTLAPTQALGAGMSNFTHIGWSLADNLQAGPLGWGGKNFFDDFVFDVPVPEPSSALAMLAAGALAAIKRPRRQRQTDRSAPAGGRR